MNRNAALLKNLELSLKGLSTSPDKSKLAEAAADALLHAPATIISAEGYAALSAERRSARGEHDCMVTLAHAGVLQMTP